MYTVKISMHKYQRCREWEKEVVSECVSDVLTAYKIYIPVCDTRITLNALCVRTCE